MRFSRGVVKIPIKYLCVFVIVVATAFFLYLHILKHQRTRGQGQCRVFPPGAKPREAEKGPVKPREAEKGPVKPRQNHTGCRREPQVNTFEQCPHCFRPAVKNVSSQLHQVQYSTSLFPRGPPDLFKPKGQVQQDFITSYLITPSLVCVDTCPYLVALLLSVSDDVAQRTAVRATWASVAKTLVWPNAQLNAHMQVVFVLAHQTEHSHIKQNQPQVPRKYAQQEEYPTLLQWTVIKDEADRFGDILYLNMQDSYYNLTLKLLSAFKWVDDHCPKAKFILKVDIDTFVNVPLLLDLLIVNEDRLEYSVLGKIYSQDRVVRRAHKWAVDAQIYPPAIFPVYASGSAYIISARLFSRMVGLSPYMPIADIFDQLQGNHTTPTDLFFTSVLGAVLGYDYFAVAAEMFTGEADTAWFWCDMVQDKKIVGRITQADGLYKMWRSVFRYYGKCWKEIPELANPRGH